MGERRCHNLLDRIARAGQFQRVGAEGVRLEDIGAGRNISPVDRRHDIAVGHIPEIRVLPRPQARGLQLRTHGAVKIQQFFS